MSLQALQFSSLNKSTYSPDSNKYGGPSVEQFDKNVKWKAISNHCIIKLTVLYKICAILNMVLHLFCLIYFLIYLSFSLAA